MRLDLHPENVDLEIDIPAQVGLSFRVNLNLQGDELHLSASRFSVEWFPCTKPEKVDKYFEAVSGLLSGRFRILEHWRGKRPVKAQLQRPNPGGWENVATWLDGSAVLPWPRKTFKVVQNKPSAQSSTNLESCSARHTMNQLGQRAFLLHAGIFALFIPLVFVDRWSKGVDPFSGKPRWVLRSMQVLFLLFVVVFFSFLALSHAASPGIIDGEYVLNSHGK